MKKAERPKQKTGKRGRIAAIICIVIVLALAALGGLVFHKKQTGTEAERTLSQMEKVIPGLGKEGVYSSGAGRDPLVVLSIRGVDVVGCLEIPSLNLRAPVTGKTYEKESFVNWVSGSPVKGRFRLEGNKSDVFLKLPKAAPGDKVLFTDVDGVRYEYTVTTQLHLKSWDKAKYDLMLCYDVDSDTQFVLGCTAEM